MPTGTIKTRLEKLERRGSGNGPLLPLIIQADGHSSKQIRAFLDAKGIPEHPLRPTIILSGYRQAGPIQKPLRFI